jgi:hypothetical protein
MSDQAIKATKNVRELLLPAWYLPKGAINASEDELDNASSSCESWGIWCGALVVVSVAAEFIIAAAQPSYDLFLKFSAVADVGVAVGIIGEVILGMRNNRLQTELRRRSNEKVGAAMDRAAEAQEELTLFRTQRHLLIHPEPARQLIRERLEPFPNVPFCVGHDPVDREQKNFLWYLEPLLTEAGWVHVDWTGGRNLFTKPNWPGNHLYGAIGVINVVLELYPEANQLKPAAHALAGALEEPSICWSG